MNCTAGRSTEGKANPRMPERVSPWSPTCRARSRRGSVTDDLVDFATMMPTMGRDDRRPLPSDDVLDGRQLPRPGSTAVQENPELDLYVQRSDSRVQCPTHDICA